LKPHPVLTNPKARGLEKLQGFLESISILESRKTSEKAKDAAERWISKHFPEFWMLPTNAARNAFFLQKKRNHNSFRRPIARNVRNRFSMKAAGLGFEGVKHA
jgi:hypothetical protein